MKIDLSQVKGLPEALQELAENGRRIQRLESVVALLIQERNKPLNTFEGQEGIICPICFERGHDQLVCPMKGRTGV